MILLAVTQVWPEFLNLAPMSPLTARSRSADGKTRKGAFPPSSMPTLFTVCPHREYRIFPTSQDPVKDTIATLLFVDSSVPTSCTLLLLQGILPAPCQLSS